MRQKITYNSREDWAKARREGIGASEIAAIMGLSKWATPYEIWERKTQQAETEPEVVGDARWRGHDLEQHVATWWAAETGRTIDESTVEDYTLVDDERPYMRVSPDREYIVDEATGERGILECKTTRLGVSADDVPLAWLLQLQMNLGVSGYKHGSLAWLSGSLEYGYIDVEFNPDLFNTICEVAERFWTENVQGGVAPAAVNNDDLTKKYPQSSSEAVEASEAVIEAIERLKDVKKQIAALDDVKDELEVEIKEALGTAETMKFCDKIVATWKSAAPSKKFNEKRFAAEHPELYESYKEEKAGTRRFLIK